MRSTQMAQNGVAEALTSPGRAALDVSPGCSDNRSYTLTGLEHVGVVLLFFLCCRPSCSTNPMGCLTLNSFNGILKIHVTEQSQVDLTHFWTCILK